MTTRQELLTQWQQRLTEAERAMAVTPSWSERVRVKLYRFLLAMYRHSPWPGAKDDVDNARGRSTQSLVVAELQPGLHGKQPRSRAEILKGLAHVKGLGEELAPAGPLAHGLLPDSPVVVAAFRKDRAAQWAIRRLQQAGFAPAIAQRGGLYQIFVSAVDSADAAACLREGESPPVSDDATAFTIAQPRGVSLPLGAILFGCAGALLTGCLLQLAFVDLSHLPAAELPTSWEIVGLGVAAGVFLLFSAFLFHMWCHVQVVPAECTPTRSPLLGWGLFLALCGISIPIYLMACVRLPLNSRMQQYLPLPSTDVTNWLAAATVILNLTAMQMLWVWWKWRQRMIAEAVEANDELQAAKSR